MDKTKFYKPVLITHSVIIDRLLDEDCDEGAKHNRLLLPKEEGQKQYCICIKCFKHSHL